MELKYIKTELKDRIAYVTFNNPQKRNALNKKMLGELGGFLEKVERKKECSILVIKGSGGSFVAGADINELRSRTMSEAILPGMQALYRRIERSPLVCVAVLNGNAFGGGFELALACDIRISSKNAKMGLPELNLGILPGAGGTQRLARCIGRGKAMEMILLSRILDATEAEELGLVYKAVEESALDEELNKIIDNLLSKSIFSLSLAKSVINQGFDLDIDSALLLEKYAQGLVFSFPDKEEGTQAFLNKRTPVFTQQREVEKER
ncbi:enoyl-CoA hydratase/isomerase family protein [Shouchella clausii]|uniref:enoyl-CoA hydratase/isomerase family protein n=1 Tax=Shouchella clausii TaxID=79880 RepID=UPI00079819FC|nr:enoyl-CoA hydratase/isomerase family protein [Shouchella clausii]KKI85198.1 hypothetical protein WZ76_17255 [Shouchella clausii]